MQNSQIENIIAHTQLLDCIETNNGHVHRGIVDFISTKHIYMISFPEYDSLDYILLASLWRMEHSHTRFSVYCITHYPHLSIPKVILIHKSDIKHTNVALSPTKKTKQRNFTIKNIKQD